MSVEQVCNLLQSWKLGKYCPSFFQNRIDGKILGELQEEDMKVLGVTELVDRKQLLYHLQLLKLNISPTEHQKECSVCVSTDDIIYLLEEYEITALEEATMKKLALTGTSCIFLTVSDLTLHFSLSFLEARKVFDELQQIIQIHKDAIQKHQT